MGRYGWNEPCHFSVARLYSSPRAGRHTFTICSGRHHTSHKFLIADATQCSFPPQWFVNWEHTSVKRLPGRATLAGSFTSLFTIFDYVKVFFPPSESSQLPLVLPQ